MRKSDKKLDNQLRECLTVVCDKALGSIPGFQWLTHMVNYSRFPDSLRVICVFDTDEQMHTYLQSDLKHLLASWVQSELAACGIRCQSLSQHVSYDTEERCERQHKGNWSKRLGQ